MRRTLLFAVAAFALLVAANAQAQIPKKYIDALYRYSPVMRFDDGMIPFVEDGEHFFPLRVSAITNNPGNRLQRPHQWPIPDETFATREPDGSGLNISWLRLTYPNGVTAEENDRVDERGNSVAQAREDADRFPNDRHYRDRIYGHIKTQANGAWLQYWFFYYYNDSPAPVVNAGDHEGDWEMIQIFVDTAAHPTVAVYAHHTDQSYCPWAKVPKERSRPVVFVARGSHASYFHDGHHGIDLYVDGDNERAMRVIRIGDRWPPWVRWPGMWGASEGGIPKIEDKSPRGPIKHGQFLDPQGFFDSAALDSDCK